MALKKSIFIKCIFLIQKGGGQWLNCERSGY